MKDLVDYFSLVDFINPNGATFVDRKALDNSSPRLFKVRVKLCYTIAAQKQQDAVEQRLLPNDVKNRFNSAFQICQGTVATANCCNGLSEREFSAVC